jgi:FkbM family methyltransferase
MQVRFYKGEITTTLHGKSVILPNGHWYALVCKKFPGFNNPLFSVAYYLTNKVQRSLNIIDVGAAVGDTVLFLDSFFSSRTFNYYCIDGDVEYIKMLRSNTKYLSDRVEIIEALISDRVEEIPEIHKDDPTTGSATGKTVKISSTIDLIVQQIGLKHVDLIKIDVDGYDGKVLAGSAIVLSKFKPFVIFEWNTPLYDLVGKDQYEPFRFLTENNYSRFLWFSNTGSFAYYQIGYNEDQILVMDRYCKDMQNINGFHYDIISFHDEITIDVNEIITINEYKLKDKIV